MDANESGQVWPASLNDPHPLKPAADKVAQNFGNLIDQAVADGGPIPGEQPTPTGKPLEVGEQRLSVQHCEACDGRHEGLQVFSYVRPRTVHTHWYKCPTVGDPVPISLIGLSDGRGILIDSDVCRALVNAQLAGRWCVAFFIVTADGQLTAQHKTHRFPHGDFFGAGGESKGCIKMLTELFEREVGPQQPAEMKTVEPAPLHSLPG